MKDRLQERLVRISPSQSLGVPVVLAETDGAGNVTYQDSSSIFLQTSAALSFLARAFA